MDNFIFDAAKKLGKGHVLKDVEFEVKQEERKITWSAHFGPMPPTYFICTFCREATRDLFEGHCLSCADRELPADVKARLAAKIALISKSLDCKVCGGRGVPTHCPDCEHDPKSSHVCCLVDHGRDPCPEGCIVVPLELYFDRMGVKGPFTFGIVNANAVSQVVFK